MQVERVLGRRKQQGNYVWHRNARMSADSEHYLNYNPRPMSRALIRFVTNSLAVGVLAVTSVMAQKPQPSPTPPDRVITTVRRVRLPITVTDKRGDFVPGLTQNDFVILEDKVPQRIETFSDDLS